MMSQNVWKDVAPLIAETGRYEVLAPTMLGHNGGVRRVLPAFRRAGRRCGTPDGRAGLGHRPHRRQLARRLGGLRTGAPRPGPHADRHRPGGRLASFHPGEVRDRRQVPGRPAAVAGHPGARPARAETADHPPARVPAGQRDAGRPVRRGPRRHHRRRLALPGVLPAAGQVADVAGTAGDGRGQRADAPGDLREGPGAAAPAVHPALHHATAEGHPDHAPRRRRAHPDVRGAAPGRRPDRRLRRPVRGARRPRRRSARCRGTS